MGQGQQRVLPAIPEHRWRGALVVCTQAKGKNRKTHPSRPLGWPLLRPLFRVGSLRLAAQARRMLSGRVLECRPQLRLLDAHRSPNESRALALGGLCLNTLSRLHPERGLRNPLARLRQDRHLGLLRTDQGASVAGCSHHRQRQERR